ncbi:hypothetical protein PanWU01x14_069650, partial [Parasponia andersonii]
TEDGRRRRSAAARHRWLQREEVDSDRAGVHGGEKRPRRRVGDKEHRWLWPVEVGSNGVGVDGEKHPRRRVSRSVCRQRQSIDEGASVEGVSVFLGAV